MKFIYFLLFFTCLSSIGISQSNDIRFNRMTGSNGISIGKIGCMLRDHDGAIWFGDQDNSSITRYDGSQMTSFRHQHNNANTLGGQIPESMVLDSNGIIWIGFYGQGLDRFDPSTNSFTHYHHNDANPNSLASDVVNNILIDHLGQIWIGTDAGLDLLDPAKGTFTHFRHAENNPGSLSNDFVRALYEDREGTLWVGTGFPWYLDDSGGLNRFDHEKKTFIHYLHDAKDPQTLIDNKVRSIFEDSKGNFWIGTRGDGLHRMNKKTGKFERISSVNPDRHQPCRPPVIGAYDHITFINEDYEGGIWIGTLANGLARYDPQTQYTTFFNSTAEDKHGFTDNSAWMAYTSTDGQIWISTQETSLFEVELYQNNITHYNLKGSTLYNVEEDKPGIFWLATSDGLLYKNLFSGEVREYRPDPHDSNSLSSIYINCLLKDRQGTLWIATANGLNRYDPVHDKFKRFMYDPTYGQTSGIKGISGLYADDSNLWIASIGGGVIRLDLQTEKLTSYLHTDSDTTSIINNDVSGIFGDPGGDLWISNLDFGGLNRLQIKTGKFKHYLPENEINDILFDTDENMWVGTKAGLYTYNRKDDVFSLVNITSGSNSPLIVISLVEDDQRNLWIGSPEGLFRLDSSRQNVVRFGRAYGINGTNLTFASAYKSKTGYLLFGTQTGYYLFNPKDLKVISSPVNLKLTHLWLNGVQVNPGVNSPLQHSLEKTELIPLHYNQNAFAIGYSMINFGHAEDKVIYYKLDRYDREWRPGTPEGKAYYYNVPPGKYKFLVKATNLNSDKWVEKSVDVIISPPWWNTWYAYVLYATLLFLFAFYGYQFQKRRLLKAERERTKDKELTQAKEIEKAYNELKTTQTQLIHAEKMASLGELTAGIAHEIQNPLNFVNNFSELNAELIDELNSELATGNVQQAKDIGVNIKENEEKIIFHGKRADAIVKSMLLHSRKGSDQKELTDINAMVDEYVRLAYHGMRAKDKSFNVDFKTELDPGLPKINVVQQDMGRVLLNLINNAFQALNSAPYPPEGGHKKIPTVKVGTKQVPTPGGRGQGLVVISISDNGPGIPDSIKDKIFQPFFTTKPAGQGTGLGLSLSYDIIKAHGGEIKIETKEGEGTTFIITLPA